MTTREFKGIVKLTKPQYLELKTIGHIVINGQTIPYSPKDTVYAVEGDYLIDVSNETEGITNDVILEINNNTLSAQLKQGIKTIVADIAPTTETVGTVGQFYLNKTSSKVYICINDTDNYIWLQLN